MKKFKIVISLILIFTLSTLLLACNKKKEDPYKYTENSSLSFDNLKDISTFTTSHLISPDSAFNSETGDVYLVPGYDLIIVKVQYPSGAEKYGLFDYDGKRLYDTVYDYMDFSFNTLRFLKGAEWTLKNYDLNTEITFSGGTPYPLYNNLIAFFPMSPSYKIDICDYSKTVRFNIYDKQRDKLDDSNETNKLTNYGNYIVYRNDEFKTYTVYDKDGKSLFEIPSVAASKFFYIGNDKFLNMYTEISGQWKTRTLLYDISDNINYKEIMVDDPIREVFSRQADKSTISDGFRIAFTNKGKTLVLNGKTAENGELITKEIPSLSPFTTEQGGKLYCINNVEFQLNIYNNVGEKQSELSPMHEPVVNEGYIVAGYPIETTLKYGIYGGDGARVLNNSFDYLSPVVGGIAFGYNKNSSGKKTFSKVTISGGQAVAAPTTQDSISDVADGIYFSFVDGVLKCYNFLGVKLFETSDVNTYNTFTTYNNNGVIIVVDKGATSHLYIVK